VKIRDIPSQSKALIEEVNAALGLFFVVCLFLDFASLVNSAHNPSEALFSVSQFNHGEDKAICGNRYWIASTCRSHLVKPSLKTEKKSRNSEAFFHLLFKRGNLQHNV
jgi:hypothetical protein